MLSTPQRQIIVASDFELTQDSYYCRLWLAANNLGKTLPRRSWLDEMADCFRDYQGEILSPCGEPFVLSDLDDIFGDDPDARWLSNYLKADETGAFPLIKARLLDRLRIIDLFLRIRCPQLVDHFGN